MGREWGEGRRDLLVLVLIVLVLCLYQLTWNRRYLGQKPEVPEPAGKQITTAISAFSVTFFIWFSATWRELGCKRLGLIAAKAEASWQRA